MLILDTGTDPRSSLETKSAPPPEGKATLPALGSIDMEAGVQKAGTTYTTDRIGTLCGYAGGLRGGDQWARTLHSRGHLVLEQVLAELFFNTVFQYNTRRFLGYDPFLNYGQYPALEKYDANYRNWLEAFCKPSGIQVLEPPPEGGDFKPFLAYKAAAERAIESFKGNRTLIQLGIAYLRQKVVVEKLHDALKGQSGDAAAKIQKVLLARDRLATDLQTMAFELMKAGYKEFLTQYLAAPAETRTAAGDLLLDYRPAFASEPYYSAILGHILDFTRPTNEVDGIKLPAPEKQAL